MHLRYDPTGLSLDNHIQNERNYILTGVNIYPKYEYGFFATGMVLYGVNDANPSGVLLVVGVDYSFPAQIEPLSTILGVNIYDHVVLSITALSTYQSLRHYYHAIGDFVSYDSTASAAKNYILNECFPVGSIFRVRPFMNVDFYATNLDVIGYNNANPGGVTLVSGLDFALSAPIQPYTDSLGVNVHSHFDLLTNDYDLIKFSYRAVGNTLDYDPSMSNPANYITDEEHFIDDTLCIVPLAHSAFFEDDFIAVGYNISNPTGLVLKELQDFFFSPLYLTYAQATGRKVYSYIVPTANVWDSIKISYRGVGANIDANLFGEILAAGSFDRLDPLEWMDFQGEMKTLDVAYIQNSPPPTSFLQSLNLKLDQLVSAIGAIPAAPVVSLPTSLMNVFTDKMDELNTQQVEYASIVAELGEYGVVGQRIKFIPDSTYIVTNYDTGYTLAFTNPTGCTVTIPETLNPRVWFRFLQYVGGGQVTWVGGTGVTFFSADNISSTFQVGEVCSFVQTEALKFLVLSTRTEEDAGAGLIVPVTGNTLTISANLHNGKILVFKHASGCTVTIPDNLPAGMTWKEHKFVITGQVTHNPAVGVTLFNEDNVDTLENKGELMEIVKIDHGANVFFSVSSRGAESQLIRLKSTSSNPYTLTDNDSGRTVIFTNNSGTININTGLKTPFKCRLLKSSATGTIGLAGSATLAGNYNAAGLKYQYEMVEVSTIDTDTYLLNSNKKDLPNDVVTTVTLNAALANLTNKVSNVRQCTLSGEVDPTLGDAAFLQRSGDNIITKNAVDKYFSFGDGFDLTGERNYVVRLPAATVLTWSSALIDTTNKLLYIEYNELAQTLSTGYNLVNNPPIYSRVKPLTPNNNQYWYPTDHRSRGEYWNGSAWIPVLRLYVAFAGANQPSPYVFSFDYQGKAVTTYNWVNIPAGNVPQYKLINFHGDNCDYEVDLYLEVTTNSLSGNGYELGELIKAPIVNYNSTANRTTGFNISRKKDGDGSRYQGFNIVQTESDDTYKNHVILLDRASNNPLVAALSNFKFVAMVKRSF